MPWTRCQPRVADSIQTHGHFFPRAGRVSAPLWPLPTPAWRGCPVLATAGLLAQPGCGHCPLGPTVMSGRRGPATKRHYGRGRAECSPGAGCQQGGRGLLERPAKPNTAELVWQTIRDVLWRHEWAEPGDVKCLLCVSTGRSDEGWGRRSSSRR